jgi:hypothetical protein
MDILSKIGAFLNGKKSYITAILIGIGGVLVSLGYTIPEYVWILLAAAGFAAVRSAVDKLPKQ